MGINRIGYLSIVDLQSAVRPTPTTFRKRSMNNQISKTCVSNWCL